ncbi:MAG: GFA family protein [Pseudoxanthomonas sp.]
METQLLSGRCACGQTVFQINAATACEVCYCDTCRQVSGGVGMAWATGLRASLSMHGPVSRWRSSDHAFRHFCASCGTQLLLIQEQAGDMVKIAVGALEPQDCMRMDHESHRESRPRWARSLTVAVSCQS